MITPKQAAESLTVPTSTLRRWAQRFAAHLSPHKPGTHREYTLTDLDMLGRIRDLLDTGLTYDDIDRQLDVVDTPTENTRSLAVQAEIIQVLEEYRATVQTLSTKIDKQGERIDQLESWLTTPWYKRRGKNKPF